MMLDPSNLPTIQRSGGFRTANPARRYEGTSQSPAAAAVPAAIAVNAAPPLRFTGGSDWCFFPCAPTPALQRMLTEMALCDLHSAQMAVAHKSVEALNAYVPGDGLFRFAIPRTSLMS